MSLIIKGKKLQDFIQLFTPSSNAIYYIEDGGVSFKISQDSIIQAERDARISDVANLQTQINTLSGGLTAHATEIIYGVTRTATDIETKAETIDNIQVSPLKLASYFLYKLTQNLVINGIWNFIGSPILSFLSTSSVVVTDTNQKLVSQAMQTGFNKPFGQGSNTITQGNDSRIPTQPENDALQGTDGSPSGTNRYVTNSDPRLITPSTTQYLNTPVSNITALKAINTTNNTNYPEGRLVLVLQNGLYRLDRTNSETENIDLIVYPSIGTGYWVKISPVEFLHNLLFGIQGGTSGDYQHLTTSQLTQVQTLTSTYIPLTRIGIANGVASLDSGGKVPTSELPSTVMEYQGAWSASANTPTLIDGTGTNGMVYRASIAGTQNLGSGSQTWAIGDLVIYNGSIWQHSPAADGVSSVFARTGAVIAQSGDYNTSQVTELTNLYYTDTRARASISLTTTGSSGASTYNNTSGVLNIPQYQAQGNYITSLTGDATASGPGSSTITLATVNSSVGTFNNVTVNAKGLITSASNIAYITGNQTITLSGPITGSGTTSIVTNIGANVVTDSNLVVLYIKADGTRALSANWNAGAFSATFNSIIIGSSPNTISGLSTIINTGTLTLPTSTDTLVARNTTDTFTNKTLTSSTNIIGGVTITLGSDSTGDIYYRNVSGILTRLAIGSTGTVLHGGTTPSYSSISLTTDISGILPSANGGTGINNGTNTITLANNLVTSGNFSLTLTQTGTTNVTLPTTGTLSTLAGIETLTNKNSYNGLIITSNTGVITTGTWNATLIGVTYGGTGTSTSFTLGSIVFIGSSGVYSQDNSNFFYDSTNKTLKQGGGVNFTYGTTNAVIHDLAGTVNTFLQISLQNKSNGINASTDSILSADTGTDSTNYVDLGINSSGNTAASWGGALDAYLYASDGNLSIGTQSTKSIYFLVDGGANSNRALQITSTGAINQGTTLGMFSISATGNITAINNVTYSWPSSQGASNSVLINNGSGTLTWKAATGGQFSPSNPTGNATTTSKMQGIGGVFKITPSKTGNILVVLSGNIVNGTNGDGSLYQLFYGTGTAPTNGAAVTGTSVGPQKLTTSTAGLVTPGQTDFVLNGYISGLTVGTAYWFDFSLAASTGGTASAGNLSGSIIEQ